MSQVFPHGSTDALPYATMGSGSLNAMAVFESSYEDDMEKSAAVDLVTRAIRSGIYNDLGSGAHSLSFSFSFSFSFGFSFRLWAWETVQAADGSCCAVSTVGMHAHAAACQALGPETTSS